jgi:dihydroorotase
MFLKRRCRSSVRRINTYARHLAGPLNAIVLAGGRGDHGTHLFCFPLAKENFFSQRIRKAVEEGFNSTKLLRFMAVR